MKKLALVMVFILLLGALPGMTSASSLPFEDDYEGINLKAQSVLMLMVYDNEEGAYTATGSGFVAFSGDTLITNYHVVEDGDLVLAESDDGRSFFLDQVIAADKQKDLAILRFKAMTSLNPLTLNHEGGVLRGQPVVAIGSPEGFRNTVSKGDISALFTEDGLRYLQFTAPISHGSSGGALFDNQGRVIGVTTSSIMGDSQNLNFAIDIREAIALYEAADISTTYDLGRLGSLAPRAEQPAGSTPPPSQDGEYENLSVTQTAPDTVRLTWSSQLHGDTTYVGFEIAGNNYYNHLTTQENSVEISDLVPGMTYLFYLSPTEAGLDYNLESVSFKLADALPYTFREANLLYLGIQQLDKGAEPSLPLQDKLTTISLDALQTARQEQEISLIYRVVLDEIPGESRGNCLYTLTSPLGMVYTDAYYFQYGEHRNAYIRRVNMDSLFGMVQEFEDEIAPGTYTAAVYHDGALLGETDFTLTAAETGKPEEEAQTRLPFEGSLKATPLEDGLRLTWAKAEGAVMYRVYRASGAKGHFFFQEGTQGTSYLETNLVPGLAYAFRVDALDEAGKTISSQTLEVNQSKPYTEEQSATPALRIGDEAYVGSTLLPYIDPDVLNTTDLDNIAGFSLAYFGEDQDYQSLPFGDSGELITYYSFDTRVKPGEVVNPGRVSLAKYGDSLKHVYVAISEIRFDDGTVVKVPLNKLDFLSWTLD